MKTRKRRVYKVVGEVLVSAKHAMSWDAYYAKEAAALIAEPVSTSEIDRALELDGLAIRLARAAAMARLCWFSKTASMITGPRVVWTLLRAESNEPVGRAWANRPLEQAAIWEIDGSLRKVKTGSPGARRALLLHVLDGIVKANR